MSLLLLFGSPPPPADGMPALTVEMAFGYTWEDPDPVWTDVSAYVLDEFTVEHGRSRELDAFQTGTATFTLVNDDRRFDPWHTTGPYYGNLKPNVPVRIRATWTSTRTVFRGFVDGWPQTYTSADVIAHVRISCSDAFKFLAALDLTQQTFTFDDENLGFDMGRFGGAGVDEEELSGQRVNTLLDLVAWPTELRDIADGVTVCQAQETSGSALEAIRTVELSEDGYFYVEADGVVTFVDRYGPQDLARMTTSQATFSDASASTYDDITHPYDDQLIYNDVRRQRTGGVEQSAEDPASIAAYFRKTHTKTGLVMNNDVTAQGLATVFLERHKEPQRRVDGLVIDPDADPTTQWGLVIGLRVLDRITVSRTPQQIGSAISGDYWIQGMRHTWSDLKWRTTYYLTPVDDFTYFTFDDDVYGLFDGDGVFAP